MTAIVYHGGNLDQASARFGVPADGWLDLSTGINPVAYPVGGLVAKDWTRLPERAHEIRLEAVAAKFYGLEDASRLVATPGTQAVIQALPWLIPATSVAILGFTYQEHAARWRQAGATVETVDDLRDPRMVAADVALVVNPNNPDGRLVRVEDLLDFGRRRTMEGKILIVDEAFMDVLPRTHSVLPALPDVGIAVMRSIGKTWGLAGLRLGFFAGPSELAGRLRDFFGPWSVSGPALRLGARAMSDTVWLTETVRRLEADSALLDAILSSSGLEPVGGTALFRLVRHDAAGAIFDRLGRAGILVRPFATRPHWLRFGIPATDRDRARLADALR